ncbi:MAG: DUF4118 domain-containing protein [Anaerolineae bacterium]|nr:DUF4118 domain-containing protein [Anaerolineae bacterium]
MRRSLPSRWLPYAVAVISVALALLVTSLLQPLLARTPLQLFFAAVTISAWYGGLGPGLTATVLATVAGNYFLSSPTYPFSFGLEQLLQLGVFAFVAVLISTLTSARRQAEEEQRFLAEAGALLATPLDYATRLDRLVHLVVPYLADWCVVDILQEDGVIRRLAVAHVEPDKEDLALDLRRRYPLLRLNTTHTITKVLHSGHSWFDPHISDTRLAAEARDTQHLDFLRQLGFKSEMVVPLVARDRPIGTLTFVMGRSGRRHTPRHLKLAEELARRAALAVDNAWLYQQAQAAIQVRDEFLSIASHELKSPLTALLLQLQLLLRHARRGSLTGLPADQLVRLLETGQGQVQRLSKLVDNLLDVSRISAGRLQLELETLDLALVARDVVARFAEEAQAAGSELTLHADQPVVGRWDRLRMDQVVTNLVTNAIKYGEGQPIEVRVEPTPTTARLAVRDHGLGIPPEHLTTIFERFERAGRERSHSGLGLGLYITRQIIQAHGGVIQVSSTLGAGSTFTVELPRE